MKIKEIMIKNVITATLFTPVAIVAMVLIEKKISGLPVVDNKGCLAGIISEKDMLRILLQEGSGDGKIAIDYMTKDVMSFGPEDEVEDVCKFFVENTVRRVPILEDGKLVGIVSRRDIMKILVRLSGVQYA